MLNFYGEYTFRDAGDIVDLDQLVSGLAALEWKNAGAEQRQIEGSIAPGGWS
jgi:hypothetical protein